MERDACGFGSRIFYTFDAQGSVAQRLDLYGNVLTSRSYTAHGQMVGKGVWPTRSATRRDGVITRTRRRGCCCSLIATMIRGQGGS
ncbi:MAG: hypothetical protein LC803_23805 [Acidobacteria bacterium]|nr:hypothetical protein [Acidobacteriota bacterium]